MGVFIDEDGFTIGIVLVDSDCWCLAMSVPHGTRMLMGQNASTQHTLDFHRRSGAVGSEVCGQL